MENMNKETRILIADDHPIFLLGLRQVLEARQGYKIVGEANDGTSALERIRETQPDIAVLDVVMPGLDGLEVVRAMRNQRHKTKPIFLTFYKDQDMVQESMELGVQGYVLKDSMASEILDAVAVVQDGMYYFSPALSSMMVKRGADGKESGKSHVYISDLTPQERRILKFVAEGRTSKVIGEMMGLSRRTVENHRLNICRKLDITGIHSLVKYAYENKARL